MNGKLIVLEGIDGSGKSTQYELLCRSLTEHGVDYHKVVFPRYNEESSALIRQYLRGDFGSKPSDVNGYAASCFFAVDRFASFRTDWEAYYNAGGLVLSDRYTTSNAVHQSSKFSDGELPAFLDWLYDFEYKKLNLPCPDLVLYLKTELSVSLASMKKRQQSTNTSADIHEKDAQYLESCIRAGNYAARHYGWRTIECVRDGALRAPEDIHGDILSAVYEIYG